MQKHDHIPEETGHSAEVSAQTKTDLLKQMLAPKPEEVTKSQPSNKNTKKPAPKKKSLGIDFSKRQKKRDWNVIDNLEALRLINELAQNERWNLKVNVTFEQSF